MALDCSAEGLAVNSAKLTGSLSFKQLLAALVYIQCTSNGMSCDAQTLSTASKCLYNCLTEKQLLSALVYIQCSTGGGGGGGGSTGATFGAYGVGNPPNFTPTSGTGLAINTSDGNQWVYYNGAWH